MIRRVVDELRQDGAFALRTFRRRPGVTAVAVLTLAVGIGATTAIYSVVDGVLLEPPPYREPDRLVVIWHRFMNLDGGRARVAGPDAALYRERAESFEDVAFVRRPDDRATDDGGDGTHVRVGVATPNLFTMLGVEMALGRTFLPDEGVGGAVLAEDEIVPPAPLMLGHEIWRSAYGADSTVVGRTVRLSGSSWEVVGVLPPDFELVLPPDAGMPGDIDAWTTLGAPLEDLRRTSGVRDQDSDNTGIALGRLAAGANPEQVRADLSVVASRQREEHQSYREAGLEIDLELLHDAIIVDARPVLLVLMGAVVFVLLVSCLNVANLQIARASDRGGEMAVRAALGAGRGRLVRQVLAESGVLAAAGAGLGVFIAVWGVHALIATAPGGLPIQSGPILSVRVLGVAIGSATAAALLFGVAPATIIGRAGGDQIRSVGPRGGGGRGTLRRGLVVSQVALSFALLVGAGLLLRSTTNLARVDPGFESHDLYTFTVTLPGGSVGGPGARAEYMNRLEDRIREMPDVEAVGLVGGLPLGGVVFRQPYGPAGSTPDDWSRNEANFRVVSSSYLKAMGTRLIAGRPFSRTEDTVEGERVALVSAGLAARLANGGNAVGRQIGFPLDGQPVFATIVGVVEDVRYQDLRRPGAETIYVPYRHEASRTVSMAVRTRGDAPGLEERIRGAAARIPSDVAIPLFEFRDMRAYVERALAPTRFALHLVSGFAVVALLLAVVGLGGVLSYMVSKRTLEFGVRIALGADPRLLLVDVLRSGIVLAAAGIVGGTAIALATSSLLRNVVFGLPRIDFVTYALVAFTLLLATVIASWLPARRVAALEPHTALRAD